MRLTRNKNKECFISHSTLDDDIMRALSDTMDLLFKNRTLFFNSFYAEEKAQIGSSRADIIKKNLHRASIMIAIITDNYLRSTICISEISSFWFAGKRVIPIIYNGDKGKKFIYDLFGMDILFIDASEDSSKCGKKLMQSLVNNGFSPGYSNSEAEMMLSSMFSKSKAHKSQKPFIGSSVEEHQLQEFCISNGILQMTNSPMAIGDLEDRLQEMDEVFIAATTGANLISMLSSRFLPDVLSKGQNVYILIPNRDSDFCMDLAEIERPNDIDNGRERLSNAFNSVLNNLWNVVSEAKAIAKSDSIGHVFFGCAFTLIRQTIIIATNSKEIWGWLSVTIPPYKTNSGTLSLELMDSKEATDTLTYSVYQHVLSIRELARKRGKYIDINSTTKQKLQEGFGLEKESAKQYWGKMKVSAEKHMEDRRNTNNLELIEVSANHPLQTNGAPSAEFSARLEYAAKLYEQYTESGKNVKIYVPGSLHQVGGIVDPYTLSEAGKRYLISKGIPQESIFGDEMNIQYKGDDGVYNSADECFVAAQIFNDGKYSVLHSVCSANQVVRKQLFYIAFGIVPVIHTVDGPSLAHDIIYELFDALPEIILNDHTWQEKDSRNGNQSRDKRKPRIG